MIEKMQLGVHTRMRNSEEDPSSMRFGGYNEELFKEGHEQVWLNTTSNMSWEVQFDSAGFHSDTLFEDKHALVDPGYPFIGMPKNQFENFKNDLIKAYSIDEIICPDDEWCYFE